MVFQFQSATVFGSNNGLKVTVEEAKSLQANAFIQAEMFQVGNFDILSSYKLMLLFC